jgi:ubiquinone/menaquinone biosynthesis C-methylase UbiE
MKNKINEVRNFYDQETDRYLRDRYMGETCEHFSYLIRKRIVLDYLKNSRGSVLDVGCGPAIFTKELIRMGLWTCSVDLSLEMLKKARNLADMALQTCWCNSQIEQLPFPNDAFDNVISIGVLAYATDTIKAVSELARVLRPGGVLVLQCSNALAPTPKVTAAKDSVLCRFGIRKKRWDFDLIKHSYQNFHAILKSCGLRIDDKRCYDFRLPFMEKFFPRSAVGTMKRLQQTFEDSKYFGWLGEGYVVKTRKIE